MTEERTSLIEVGDEVESLAGNRGIVKEIQKGRHGLLLLIHTTHVVEGEDPSAIRHAYIPNEFPPSQVTEPWYDFFLRSTLTVNGRTEVGYLAFEELYHFSGEGVDQFEAALKRTIEAVEAEEGVMQSRPTEFRLN